MFDHIAFNVRDYEISRTFYTQALAPLGIAIVEEYADGALIGKNGYVFYFGSTGPVQADFHLAFTADTRAQVEAFYSAALAAGGRDNGAPGLRAQYGEQYYAAFVLDPDGYNIEAVCRNPEA